MDEALVSADGPGFQGWLCNCEPVSRPFPEADAPEGAGLPHSPRVFDTSDAATKRSASTRA
jgi:hypothetical protein